MARWDSHPQESAAFARRTLEVDVADNGQMAVHCVAARQAQRQPYDLVLLDMQMPVMDGVTATRLLRETHSAEALPIVAMKADRDRCLEAGMNGFVTKPIKPQELWQALLRWVQPRTGQRPQASTQPPADAVAPAPAMSRGTSPSTASAELMQALQHIPDLDLALGLRRTGGKPGFYVSMLSRFVLTKADETRHIRSCLDAQDFAGAHRLAHTLKSVAAILGATLLKNSALALEDQLRMPDPANVETIDALLADVAAHLQRLIQALQALPDFLPSAPVAGSGLAIGNTDAAKEIHP